MPNQERTEERSISPLQRQQLTDAARVADVATNVAIPDQTPPWVSAGMTWTEWAAQLDRDSVIGVVAPNEAKPDA